MYIREATVNDNSELIELQAKCPQGTTIIVSTVNSPDFFARAKVYKDYKVYAVCEDDRIIASAACGIHGAVINDNVEKVGHEFQAFVHPDYRGRRIAGLLHEAREEYLKKQGAMLSYGLIIEGNKPSMRHVDRQGFKRFSTLVMPGIAVFREMPIPHKGNIRTILPEDLPAVAGLINDTWKGYEFYEPLTAQELHEVIDRTPEYNNDNIFILEEENDIVACLGFWDWNRVTQVTVKALSFKMRVMAFVTDKVRVFRPLPQVPRPGKLLKQIVLTPVGFRETGHIITLLKHVNNQAYSGGIQQIFFICKSGHPILNSLKGFIHIDTGMHLYVKQLRGNFPVCGKPVFINGFDL